MSYALGASSAQTMSDFAIEKRARQILSRLSTEGKMMLDVGCGNGLYTFRLADLNDKIIGVDISEKQIADARRFKVELKRRVEFARASAESLPFCDQCFDAVLLIEMLDHVPNHEKAIREASRVLRGSGDLIVYVPNKLYFFEVHGMRIGKKIIHGYHGSIPFLSWAPQFVRKWFERARIYTRGEIVEILERNGFLVREIDYYFPPLSKISNRAIKALLWRVITYLERNLLTRRFGMSIFVLAQKR